MTQETVDRIIKHCSTKGPKKGDKYTQCVMQEIDGLSIQKKMEIDYTDLSRIQQIEETTFLDTFLDPETGFKQYGRDMYGNTLASFTTDLLADGVEGTVKSADDFKAGNYKAAAIGALGTAARATPLGSKVGKAYDKMEDVYDKAEALASGEFPSGKRKRGKGKGRKPNKDRDSKKEKVAVKEKKKCGNRPANKNKGDCAERKVNQKYGNDYKIFDTSKITNGSGHGLDNIAYNATTMIIIETKANNSPMSKHQKLGGKEYKRKQDKAYEKGLDGKGRMKSVPNKGIEEYQRKQEGKTLQYKKCRVKLVPDPSGCYGHLGKGKCKAQSINCSDWNPE